MPTRRVVVTGMGSMSAAGAGADALWHAARDGRSGVRPVVLSRNTGHRVTIAAQVPAFDPTQHLASETLSYCDRFSVLALLAATEAVEQADASAVVSGPRCAVLVGTGLGGCVSLDDQHFAFYAQQRRIDPLTIPRVMPNAAASQISMKFGCQGPTLAVSSACASATQAIGLGMWMVRTGIVDQALVGGSEAMVTPSVFRAWESLRVLSPDLCRPFSRKRNGMALGEGAAMLVLETEEGARARGATPLAELAGYGTSSDAGDLIRPDATGETVAIRASLDDAGAGPEDIDYVNAHGTGTVLNDTTETTALRSVFGTRLRDFPVSSTKPIHGHCMGGTGALELVITIHAMREGIAPPTINFDAPDPACDLDAVPNTARATPIDMAMSTSFAFGGINAVLVVRRAA